MLQMLPGFAMATSQQDVTLGRKEPLRKGPISNPNKNKKRARDSPAAWARSSHSTVPSCGSPHPTHTSGAGNGSEGRLHLWEAELSREQHLPRPSQGMCELNEPTANRDPKTVLAEGQAVLKNLKQQREAALPNPELQGSQLSLSFPALGRVNPGV